jgi:hypothetical protein
VAEAAAAVVVAGCSRCLGRNAARIAAIALGVTPCARLPAAVCMNTTKV